ncbi:TadE/TadG family type IV pilus assembly protein [Aureimonas sp. AU20]|uniref:TadE/TadG family type IV pilus assembly protein n=1 Tax=Aureimonas sp. AU20 TaxID=1349819 RepID=UPI000A4A994A|nr:TadE/TadG family type IV pilus assembly protein [Aureimonas sp. AU20]
MTRDTTPGWRGARSCGGGRGWSLQRFRRDRSGATAVEFAILAVPFLFLTFATIETGLLFISQLTLDGGVEQVSRLVRTGQLDADDLKPETFRKLICDRVSVFLSCDKLTIDLRTYASFQDVDLSQPDASQQYGTKTEAGGSKTIMALRVFYPWTPVTDFLKLLSTSNGKVVLASVSAFRTEPY